MSRIVRIALANLPYPESPDASVVRACNAAAEAGAMGATILCFPECYVPGYRAPDKTWPPRIGTGWRPRWPLSAPRPRRRV